MTARHYKELSIKSGEPAGSHTDCTIKPIDDKIAHNMYRQSDYPILSEKPMKIGGEKGIAANTWEVRDRAVREFFTPTDKKTALKQILFMQMKVRLL